MYSRQKGGNLFSSTDFRSAKGKTEKQNLSELKLSEKAFFVASLERVKKYLLPKLSSDSYGTKRGQCREKGDL